MSYHTLGTPSSWLPTLIQVIVNKLGIWRGSLLGKTLFHSGFGGACRPLKFASHILRRFDWTLTGEPKFVQFPLKKIKDNYQIDLELRGN